MRLRHVALVMLIACHQEHAPDTDELRITYEVIQPEGGGRTHYEATFLSGDRLQTLDAGDQIDISTDGAPPGTLVPDANPLGLTYTLDRDDPPFTTATFALSRTRGGSALRSVAPFAPPLADVVPAEGTTIAYGDGSALVTMRWSNKVEGAFMTLVSHACDRADNRAASKPDPDAGKLAIPIKDLVVDGAPKEPTCLRIDLRRHLVGTLDPFITVAGSRVTGYLVHSITLTVTP